MGSQHLQQYNNSLVYHTITSDPCVPEPAVYPGGILNRLEFRRMTEFLKFEYRMLNVYIRSSRKRRCPSNSEMWQQFIDKLSGLAKHLARGLRANPDISVVVDRIRRLLVPSAGAIFYCYRCRQANSLRDRSGGCSHCHHFYVLEASPDHYMPELVTQFTMIMAHRWLKESFAMNFSTKIDRQIFILNWWRGKVGQIHDDPIEGRELADIVAASEDHVIDVADGTACWVCLEEFQISTTVKSLPCGHWLHLECLHLALQFAEQHNNECGVCRQPFM